MAISSLEDNENEHFTRRNSIPAYRKRAKVKKALVFKLFTGSFEYFQWEDL